MDCPDFAIPEQFSIDHHAMFWVLSSQMASFTIVELPSGGLGSLFGFGIPAKSLQRRQLFCLFYILFCEILQIFVFVKICAILQIVVYTKFLYLFVIKIK